METALPQLRIRTSQLVLLAICWKTIDERILSVLYPCLFLDTYGVAKMQESGMESLIG